MICMIFNAEPPKAATQVFIFLWGWGAGLRKEGGGALSHLRGAKFYDDYFGFC